MALLTNIGRYLKNKYTVEDIKDHRIVDVELVKWK